MSELTYVAIDPSTGQHLRPATDAEQAAYLAQPVRRPEFRKAVRVDAVLIDTYCGPGIWFGGAGF